MFSYMYLIRTIIILIEENMLNELLIVLGYEFINLSYKTI